MVLTLGIAEIIIIIAIFQLALFICFLVVVKRQRLSNLLLALFLFSQLVMLVSAFSYSQRELFYTHFPHFFYTSLPFFLLASPVLFFYVKSLADADFSLEKKHLIHHWTYRLTRGPSAVQLGVSLLVQ